MEKELTDEKQDSIKINRTSKGLYSWEIKLYFDDKKECGEIQIIRLRELDAKLKDNFKYE